MRKLYAALMALGIALCAPAQNSNTPADLSLDNVHGSVLRLQGATLMVGLDDGGLATFDIATKQPKLYIPGPEMGATKDVVMQGNQPWWVVENSQFVRTCFPGMKFPVDVDLRDSGLLGPIRRLSIWQEMVVAHADNGFRFIEPQSQRILNPDEVLPGDVANIAKQGIVTTSWKDGQGLFVAIRRYLPRSNPKPGEVKELGMLTAWTAAWRGEYKLLGSYTCDLVDFKDAPGPQVQMTGPSGPTVTTYGTGPIGNIKVGPEGIVALNNDQALTIPFYKDNWLTERVATAVPPKYAQLSAYNDSQMWWTNDGRLIRASLEDGASDVYVPRVRERILDLVADDEGAWILQENGIRRISEDVAGKSDFVSYEVGTDTEKPGYGGQARLAWVLQNAQRPGGHKIVASNSVDFVKAALKTAGVPVKKVATVAKNQGDDVSSLQYGDVIVQGSRASFYIGNGKELSMRENGLLTQPLSLSADARIHRFFMASARIPDGARSLPIVDIGPVFPIGVNRPNPGLGTDLFVRVNPASPYDHPFLQSHYKLLQVAEEWVGTPYRWGGSSLAGTDCSGFVTSVYRELGINLPRHSQNIARAPFGEVVFDELHFGDVLVYPNPKHVAIYIGDGRTMETTRGAVGYSNVYRRKCAYVRRFLF